MPFTGQTRAEIILSMRAEGEGTLDRARAEVARLKDEMAKATQAFTDGSMAPREYYSQISKIGPQLASFTKLVLETEGAMKANAAAMGQTISYGAAWTSVFRNAEQASRAFADTLSRDRTVYSEARQHLAALQEKVNDLSAAFIAGRMAPEEYAKGYKGLNNQIRDFRRISEEGNAAMKEQTAAMGRSKAAAVDWDHVVKTMMDTGGRLSKELQNERQLFAEMGVEIKKIGVTPGLQALVKTVEEQNAAMKEQTAAMGRSKAAAVDWDHVVKTMMDSGGKLSRELERERDLFAEVGVEVKKIGVTPGLQSLVRTAEEQNAAMKEQTAAMRRSKEAAVDWSQVQAIMMNTAGKLTDALQEEARMFATVGVESGKIGKTPALIAEMKKQAADSHGSFTNLSYAMLHVSHGLQDLQYGWGAFVNNIPLIVTSLGGGAGLAGTVMLVGTAANVSLPQIRDFAREVGLLEDPTKRVSGTVKEMQDKLKALEEKPYKLEVDYQAIRNAEEEVTLLEKRVQAAKSAAEARTSVQEESGKIVKEAIVEGGGATDTVSGEENLRRMIESGFRTPDGKYGKVFENDPDFKKLEAAQEIVVRGEEQMKTADFDQASQIAGTLSEAREEVARIKNKFEDRIKTRIDELLGGSLRGEGKAIEALLEFHDQNQDLFAKGDPTRGIQPVSPLFRLNLADAAPQAVVAARKQKSREDDGKRMAKLTEDLTRKTKRESDEQERNDDLLQRDLDQENAQYARERKSEIQHHITTFHTAFKKEGSLPGIIRAGIAAGANDDTLMKDMFEQTHQRVVNTGNVKNPWIVEEVSKGLIRKFIEEVRAQNAAENPNQAQGAQTIIDEGNAKIRAKEARAAAARTRAAQAAARREAKQAKVETENKLSDVIFNNSQRETGVQFTPEASAVAAHRAMQLVQHGHDANSSMMIAMTQVLHNFMIEQERANEQMWGIQAGFMGLQGQQNAARFRQPPILPAFPR